MKARISCCNLVPDTVLSDGQLHQSHEHLADASIIGNLKPVGGGLVSRPLSKAGQSVSFYSRKHTPTRQVRISDVDRGWRWNCKRQPPLEPMSMSRSGSFSAGS